jgi:hypothetical protein
MRLWPRRLPAAWEKCFAAVDDPGWTPVLVFNFVEELRCVAPIK